MLFSRGCAINFVSNSIPLSARAATNDADGALIKDICAFQKSCYKEVLHVAIATTVLVDTDAHIIISKNIITYYTQYALYRQ